MYRCFPPWTIEHCFGVPAAEPTDDTIPEGGLAILAAFFAPHRP